MYLNVVVWHCFHVILAFLYARVGYSLAMELASTTITRPTQYCATGTRICHQFN